MRKLIPLLLVVFLISTLALSASAEYVSPLPVNTDYSITLTGTSSNPFETRNGQYSVGSLGFDFTLLAVVVIRDDGFVVPSSSYTLNVYSDDWHYNATPFYKEGILDIYGYYNPDYIEVSIITPENCSYFIVAIDDAYSEDYMYSVSLLQSQAFYLIGQNDGETLGYYLGYNDGYNFGFSDFDNLPSVVLDIVSTPFTAIRNALNFSILGINLASLAFFAITAVLIAFLLKKMK